jgi:hypothetical protein
MSDPNTKNKVSQTENNQLQFVQPGSQIIYNVQLENGFVATNPYALENVRPSSVQNYGYHSDLNPK